MIATEGAWTGGSVDSTAMESYRADAALVRRVQGGDLEAFEQLFERHQRRVYGIAYGMLHSAEDAEDVTQETFVNAYRALSRLTDGQAFHAWIGRIAINLCRSRARRFRPESVLSLDAEESETSTPLQIADSGLQPQEVVEAEELQGRVRQAIARLAPEFREVVVLHEMEGLRLDEVAAVLKVPLGTVKSRLSRGRSYLKRALSAYIHAAELPAPAAETGRGRE